MELHHIGWSSVHFQSASCIPAIFVIWLISQGAEQIISGSFSFLISILGFSFFQIVDFDLRPMIFAWMHLLVSRSHQYLGAACWFSSLGTAHFDQTHQHICQRVLTTWILEIWSYSFQISPVCAIPFESGRSSSSGDHILASWCKHLLSGQSRSCRRRCLFSP